MSLEAALRAALGSLVEDRIYPDVLEEGGDFPAIVYQQVGGRAGWYADQTLPGDLHARVQINVWARTRIEANELARQTEALIASQIKPSQPYGAFTAIYQELLGLYGTRQDFGIWYQP